MSGFGQCEQQSWVGQFDLVAQVQALCNPYTVLIVWVKTYIRSFSALTIPICPQSISTILEDRLVAVTSERSE